MAFIYGSITNCKVVNGQTRDEYECRLGYEVQSQSIANNTSSVKLRLQVRSISSTYKTYGYNQTTKIDGTSLAAKTFDMRSTNTWQTFGERTITVTHNNEGNYSSSKSGSFTTTCSSSNGGNYSLKSGSASVTVAPAKIPRYATSNQSLKSKTSSSITMNWSSDNTIDYIWYSKDNGSNWTGVDVTDGTSGTYTISGLSANTTYNIKTRVRRKDSQMTTDSATLAVTTYAKTQPSISVTARTINSITVSSSANVAVSETKYRIKPNGGSYGGWQTSNTFSGLTQNTTYVIEVSKTGTDSKETGTATTSATTYNIATLKSVPDSINIGQNPTITFENPSGSTIYVYTENINMSTGEIESVITSDVNVTGKTSYTIPLPSNTLYSKVPNRNDGKIRYVLKTVCNGVNYWHTADRPYYVTNSNPIFTDFDFQDTNDNIYALTKNRQVLVSGYSNLEISIPTNKKAQTNNYAGSITKYRLNVGNMSSVEEAYKADGTVYLRINAVNSGSMSVTAIDSRGNSTPVQKTATFKAYKRPAIAKMSATRSDSGVGSEVTLSFEGTWWNDSFGSVTNTIKSIKYYYKTTNSSTWTQGTTTITATVSGTKFSGNVIILGPSGTDKGFDIATAYNIKLSVTDELATSAEYQTTLSSGTPALAIYKSRVAINRMYDENSETALLVGEGGINLPAGNVDTVNNAYKANSQTILRHTSNGATVVSGALSGTDRKIYLRPGGTTEDSGQMTIGTDGKVSITNEMSMSKNAPEDVYYRSKRTDTGTEIGFGVGSGGVNHGLWSYKLDKWMIYGDASNVYLNGTASKATLADRADKIGTGTRNTTDTWIPVMRSGYIDHTLRRFYNSVAHTNYPNEQDNLATIEFLSYWNGAYNGSGNSNLSKCSGGTICAEKSKSIVAAENDTISYIVLGSLLVCWGNSTITPVKDTPTSKTINFPKSFSLKPVVICTPSTSVPGTTVLGVGVNEISGTGCKLWITRTGTTSTSLLWIAIGQAS